LPMSITRSILKYSYFKLHLVQILIKGKAKLLFSIRKTDGKTNY
jgi:hypothetical protein